MKKFILLISLIYINNTVTAFAAYYPYKFSYDTEILLILTGAGLSITGIELKRKQTGLSIEDINNANYKNINFIDRPMMNYWSKDASKVSDLGLFILEAAPLFLFFTDELRPHLLTTSLMYLNGWLINSGITETVKGLSQRKRPYVYNNNVDNTFKINQGKDAKRSFMSGHTSHAFYSAVFISKVFSDIYPNSKFKGAFLYSSVTIAGLVGYLRIIAGKHFFTDVVAGAFCGAATGFFIPEIHKNTEGLKVYPIISNTKGIAFLYSF